MISHLARSPLAGSRRVPPKTGGTSCAGEAAGAARAAVCAGERTANRSGAPHVVKPAAGKRQEAAVREVLAGLGERVTFHS